MFNFKRTSIFHERYLICLFGRKMITNLPYVYLRMYTKTYVKNCLAQPHLFFERLIFLHRNFWQRTKIAKSRNLRMNTKLTNFFHGQLRIPFSEYDIKIRMHFLNRAEYIKQHFFLLFCHLKVTMVEIIVLVSKK